MDEADAAEFDGANLALELDLPVQRGESCAGVAAEDACEAEQRQEAEVWSFRGLKSPCANAVIKVNLVAARRDL